MRLELQMYLLRLALERQFLRVRHVVPGRRRLLADPALLLVRRRVLVRDVPRAEDDEGVRRAGDVFWRDAAVFARLGVFGSGLPPALRCGLVDLRIGGRRDE